MLRVHVKIQNFGPLHMRLKSLTRSISLKDSDINLIVRDIEELLDL